MPIEPILCDMKDRLHWAFKPFLVILGESAEEISEKSRHEEVNERFVEILAWL